MRAVVAGHLCVDLVPTLHAAPSDSCAEVFRPGCVVSARGLDVALGGVVGNTGVALSILGQPVTLMAAVGCDYLGEQVIRMLGEHTTTAAIAQVPGERTSYSVVLAPPGRDRTFIHDPGANDTFGVNNVSWDVVDEAALFHFGYPPVMRRMYEDGGSELTEIFRKARSRGVTTCLDMCMPDPTGPSGSVDWRSLIRRVTPHVDILAPSIDELLAMLNPAGLDTTPGALLSTDTLLRTLRTLSGTLMQWGARVVVIKCGAAGAYVRTANAAALARCGRALEALAESWSDTEMFHPSFHLPRIVNTTGAGDAFIAGLLCGVLEKDGPADALSMACATGALSTQSAGACEALETRDSIRDRMRDGWRVNAPESVPYGWEQGPRSTLVACASSTTVTV